MAVLKYGEVKGKQKGNRKKIEFPRKQ